MARRKTAARRRPCWVVLAPGKRKQLEPTIREARGGARWEIVEGKAGYLAVIELEPGSEGAGDDELAAALSKRASRPVYLLYLDDEAPRVQAFRRGKYAGDVSAWPDSVATSLGCRFPQQVGSRLKPAELRIRKSPEARADDPRIGRWTIKQWQHMIRHDDNWSVLVDGMEPKGVAQVIAALGHGDADTRAVACELADALGVHELKAKGAAVLERLLSLSRSDPAKAVRKVAASAFDSLGSSIEQAAIQRELPWISNWDRDAVTQALAALDDPRPSIRRRVCSWWGRAWEIPTSVRAKLVKKLAALVKREPDAALRESARYALERVRKKIAVSARSRR